jgi:phage shock protein A
MRHKTTSSRLKVKKSLYDTSAEDAVSRFDRFERKLDELESEVESYDIGRNKNLADEINELEKEEEIDQQLAELKARVSKTKK